MNLSPLEFIRNESLFQKPFICDPFWNSYLNRQKKTEKLILFVFLQPSSCLSDKEEDEIYGFGYGVFAPRVCRPVLHQPTTTVNVHHHPGSQSTQQSVQQPQQVGSSIHYSPLYSVCKLYTLKY